MEERERIEKALQQIRFENYMARQKAKEKAAEMLRPSSGMKHSFGCDAPDKKTIKESYGPEEEAEEDYEEPAAEEELEDIQEEIEEEHVADDMALKEELTTLKTMSIQMKTMKAQIREQAEKIEEELVGIAEENKEGGASETSAETTEKADDKKKEDVKDKEKYNKMIDYLAGNDENGNDDGGENNEEDKDEDRKGDEGNTEEASSAIVQHKLTERIKLLRQYAAYDVS